ncbi:MAG: hypothetical protein H6963_03435 [Chromatiaceae bacterium]|nr:hypothetical protein [Chromatiaceae bacterium]
MKTPKFLNACILGTILGFFLVGSSTTQASLTDGLVAFFPFNSNANDESGNGNNGVVYGATPATDRFGNENSAFFFDGLDDYISFDFDTSSDDTWTWTFWIKDDPNACGNSYWCRWLTTSTGAIDPSTTIVFIREDYSPSLGSYVELWGGASWALSDSVSFWKDSEWHFFAVVSDGTDTKVFYDGIYLMAANSSSDPDPGFYIGGYFSTSNKEFMKGSIDDVRIYDRALSQADIAELYAIPNSYAVQADAGPDQTVDEGDQVTLDGSGSTRADGYSWSKVAGPTVTLDLTDPVHPTFSAPFIGENVTLTFELIVTDANQNASDPDTVDITLVNVNNPPIADAGDDSTIKEGALATLDGSNSYDPEGGPVFYSWSHAAGPTVALSDATAVSPTFTPALNTAGTVTFGLQVCDNLECSTPSGFDDSSQSDTVEVTIVENSAPIAVAGADETKDEGTVVNLDGTGSSDPDGGDIISFSWTQLTGQTIVLNGADTATPSFDALAVQPGGENFTFELTVTDNDPVNAQSATDTVVINVRNINDPPSCDLAVASRNKLWPPNHKMKLVEIEGVMDADSIYNMVKLQVTGVTQDEPINGEGDGDSSPDAVIQPDDPADSVLVRAERAGGGNGRVYSIQFMADDGFESCTGNVNVSVPKSRKKTAVDDGQNYDSTAP